MHSMTDALRKHGDKQFHFATLNQSLSYGEVHHQAQCLARALRLRGVRPGELVGLMFGTCPEFLAAFFGVLAAGAVVVPLPQPSGLRGLPAYLDRVQRVLLDAKARVLIVADELLPLPALVPNGVVALRTGDLLHEAGRDARDAGTAPASFESSQLALVQYTSGSTSEPKGVALTHANLAAGIAAIAHGIALSSDDVNGQWLPLHHDMGLIGLLAGVKFGVTHHLWSPASFIRRPGDWLTEFAARRATIYAGPNFSFASMLNKTSEAQLAALDLSAWRVAFNGSETIDPACLGSFLSRFSRAGFRPQTMLPVYGLAEATLAVTFPKLGTEPHVDWVDAAALASERRLLKSAPSALGARGLVGVGSAVLGHELRIRTEDGTDAGDGVTGEIEVRGPAVMSSYWNKSKTESQVSADGWFRTGDIGALSEGQLVVCGRIKEMIIVRGTNFYPQDVENVVRRLAGVYQGRAVAFGIDTPAAERVVVVAETEAWAAENVVRLGKAAVAAELGLQEVEIVAVRPRSILRTTSGKPQRLLMRDSYLRAALAGTFRATEVRLSPQ